MSHVLKMTNQLIIKKLLELGWSYRRIEVETGIPRETISKYDPRHPRYQPSAVDGNTLPADSIQNRPNCPPTPSDPEDPRLELAAASPLALPSPRSHSGAAPFNDFIRQKLSVGLTAQRIYQDLVSDHGFTHGYDCVKRYVRQLKRKQPKVGSLLLEEVIYSPTQPDPVTIAQDEFARFTCACLAPNRC
ncbi:MAG: hypothetical protein DKINENOH_03016 [bacterium]|nr:hypothetical protein [bacterium]